MATRIGFGCDTHRLVAGRPLILGGIQIPHEKGLDGHSDTVTHTIVDAQLVRNGDAVLSRTEEKLVEMSNSCICCTLREDLLQEVARLAREERFDYLLIESTGISEPLPVAETFTFLDEQGQSLTDFTRLDTMVTVIDAFNFPREMHDLALLVGVSESAVSHQLRLLRGRRLVRQKRNGNIINYSLADCHLAVLFREAEYHADHVYQGLPDHPYGTEEQRK